MAHHLRTDRTLYLDLELTCWEGQSPSGEWPEIIQVGIVEVDTKTLAITRKASYYVKPTVSKVSAFCTALTGVTQRQVDRQGLPFHEVLRAIVKKFGAANKGTFTWGNDENAWKEACSVDGLFPTLQFFNLGWFYSAAMGTTKAVSLEDALKSLGEEFTGNAHDALVDAENTARLHMALMRRMRGAE